MREWCGQNRVIILRIGGTEGYSMNGKQPHYPSKNKSRLSIIFEGVESMEHWQILSQLINSLPPELQADLPTQAPSLSRPLASPLTLPQAQQLYLSLLKTHPGRKNWKLEESNFLLYVVDKLKLVWRSGQNLDENHWVKIAQFLPYRSADECKFRYLSSVARRISDSPWSHEEGAILSRIVQNQSGSLKWAEISRQFHSSSNVFRTAKQCREHYNCFLRPELKKGTWTEFEDYQLISLYLEYGRKWSKIAKIIQGRNENSIKNRFFLMFRRKKDEILTPSDLLKLVKRRLQKLSKRLGLHPELSNGSQTPTEVSECQGNPTAPPQLHLEGPLNHFGPYTEQEYEKYIDL